MTHTTATHDPTGAGGGIGSGCAGDEPSSERERARRAAEEIKTAARDAAASTAGALRNRLSGELDYRKYRSRQRLHRVADALRGAGNEMSGDDEVIGRYMERAADRVERFARYLDQRDIDQILHDTREMARRHPEIFVGSMFVAGLLLGRFLRSTAPDGGEQRAWDEYASYAGAGMQSPYIRTGTISPSVEGRLP